MRDWQATLEQGGYKIGVANLALFYNAEKHCRGGNQGDDIVVVGSRRALDWMATLYLASTPCENRTDLALATTVNATPNC